MYQSYPISLHAPRDRFAFFRDVVARVFCPQSIEPAARGRDEFSASLSTAELGEVALARVSTSPCTVTRRLEDIARADTSRFLVKFQLQGRSICSQRGREAHLDPGDFVICSTAEPYTLRFDAAYAMPVLSLDEQTMQRLTPDPWQFLGLRMSGEDPDCGLLSSFVAQVVARLDRLTEPVVSRAESNILDLLSCVLNARTRHKALPPDRQRQRIKEFVRQRLKDPRLSAALVAAEFGISTRYVHSLFRGESMSLGQYVRQLRLEECRRELEADTGARLCLTDLALRWGFYDLSHFSRCFRERFDLTPNQLRARAAQLHADSVQHG